MDPRNAVADFIGREERGDKWQLKAFCPASGNRFLTSPMPLSRKPEDVRSVWCPYCHIDHPLNVRRGL